MFKCKSDNTQGTLGYRPSGAYGWRQHLFCKHLLSPIKILDAERQCIKPPAELRCLPAVLPGSSIIPYALPSCATGLATCNGNAWVV